MLPLQMWELAKADRVAIINKIAHRYQLRIIIGAVMVGQLLAVSFYLQCGGRFYLPKSVERKIVQLKVMLWSYNEIDFALEDELVTKPCDFQRELPKQNYVVISATTPPDDPARCAKGNAECSYAFYLPITAMAWTRFNYSVVVLIAGDDKPWLRQGSFLNVVYRNLVDEAKASVIFLPVEDDYKLIVALVGRIFVPDLDDFAKQPLSYMVMSDADLVPVQDIYKLTSQYDDVNIVNAKCCGTFEHAGEANIRMVSMAGVGMRISTWHTVMKYRELSNKANFVERIKEAIEWEFGHLPSRVRRGNNAGWFLDQEFISYKLHLWLHGWKQKCEGNDFVKQFWPPVTGVQVHSQDIRRLEAGSWPLHLWPFEWEDYTDANCPIPGQAWESFKYFQPFIETILGSNFDAMNYWRNFTTSVYDNNSIKNTTELMEEIKLLPFSNYGSVNLYHPNLNNDDDEAIMSRSMENFQ